MFWPKIVLIGMDLIQLYYWAAEIVLKSDTIICFNTIFVCIQLKVCMYTQV